MTIAPSSDPPTSRQGGASVITYRLGGRDYPLRTVAQCRVCSSPHRFEIEKEIAAGRVYKRIVEAMQINDPECDLKVASLNEHYRNGHMPMEIEATRQIIERRAAQRGMDVQNGVDALVDGVTLAEAVVQKTFEAMQRGEIKPDLRDGLTAARLLETFAPAVAGADAGTYAQAFMVYHEIAQMVMTPGQFDEFGKRLGDNATLRALIARYSEGDGPEDAADEPVDEQSSQTVVTVIAEPPPPDSQSKVDNGDPQG